jgi:periplasmic copper chaperone A
MSRVLKTTALLAAILNTTMVSAHEFKIKSLEFIHPWTREPARDVKDVPVYMVLRNTGSRPDRIIAASSPFATKAELRAGRVEGETLVDAIQIPAKATVELNADRPHIVLLGLRESLEGYQYFPLVLTFERAGRMEIEVYVEEPN